MRFRMTGGKYETGQRRVGAVNVGVNSNGRSSPKLNNGPIEIAAFKLCQASECVSAITAAVDGSKGHL